ncbi:hypothetical protein AVEN_210463-1 [Araneus ventricosus]|uniref:Uncharacterized protein n=1 Tax=Araneus ventricosus TaxID=182803 RepID=A0A4Y2HSL6_ARAVE|nr:hypothetical protein AVEN_210463-1 [Araneus ventricosus]
MAGLSSLISKLRFPLKTTCLTAFSPLSEQQPSEIRPTSIEVAWPVTAGLGVKVLKSRFVLRQAVSSDEPRNFEPRSYGKDETLSKLFSPHRVRSLSLICSRPAYTASLHWNQVLSLEACGPYPETLPLDHRGP